jgi:hypothetical protein
MENRFRFFIAKQARGCAGRVASKEINESAVQNLLFADADSCNTYREDKGSLFYYGCGYYHALLDEKGVAHD